jgi:hypothetical protein
VVFLIVAMLSPLIAFFALFVGLVRFAERIIRRLGETALLPTGALSKPPRLAPSREGSGANFRHTREWRWLPMSWSACR